MLDLHRQQNDFLLVLDYHDDVVVFDSATSPQNVAFYQVKTKNSGNWTLPQLLKVAKGQTLSIIGKLYAHHLTFGQDISSLNLLSNAPYSLKFRDKPDSSVTREATRLSELCDNALQNVAEALQREHALSELPHVGVDILFTTDTLSLRDHRTHAKGRFVSFLEEEEVQTTYVSNAFKAIIEEIEKRTSCEDDICGVEDMKTKKGFSRQDLVEAIALLQKSSDPTRWAELHSLLTRDGATIAALRRYRNALETYQVQRLDRTNAMLIRLREFVKGNIEDMKAVMDIHPLPPFMEAVVDTCIGKARSNGIVASRDTITGVLLSILCETE